MRRKLACYDLEKSGKESMEIKNLSDKELTSALASLVKKEREKSAEILLHLNEVE